MVYPTFARTLPPPEKIAKSIVAVLRHFNWDRVVVLAGQHGQRFIKIKDEFLVCLKFNTRNTVCVKIVAFKVKNINNPWHTV